MSSSSSHSPVRGPIPDQAGRLAPLLRDLEALRTALHERLDALEEIARHRPTAEANGRSAALGRRAEELEAELAELRKDRQSTISGLDHDRRLLAAAWERLEREQGQAPRHATPPPPADGPPTPPRPFARPPRPATATVPAPQDDQITREVLRQFQALKHDVRRSNRKGATR